MATIRDYVDILRQKELAIARKLGTDLAGVETQARVMNLSLLVLLAVLIKALVDNGAITNAQLNAVLDTASDGVWWSESTDPIDPRGT